MNILQSKKVKTEDWKGLSEPKLLAIGHDPRLHDSYTIAPHCFFANYYFEPVPTKTNEKKKYGLAKTLFDSLLDITDNKISAKEIYVTNLCNYALPQVSKGKTVYIPEEKAKQGLDNIKSIISDSNIFLIISMSTQVNYWLQKLNYYNSNDDYLKFAEPVYKYTKLQNPYYIPNRRDNLFQKICGRKFIINNNVFLFPALHPKSYTLNRKYYKQYYDKMKKEIKDIIELKN